MVRVLSGTAFTEIQPRLRAAFAKFYLGCMLLQKKLGCLRPWQVKKGGVQREYYFEGWQYKAIGAWVNGT
jgi:hypothetical protein